MKVKTLANGLELRHSGDGFTLSFIPANGKGGALLNMSHVAVERGGITSGTMMRVMGEVIEEECIFTQNERLKVIITERERDFDKLVTNLKSVFNPIRECRNPLHNSLEHQIEQVREIINKLDGELE